MENYVFPTVQQRLDTGHMPISGMDALLFALALETSLLQIHILEGSSYLRLKFLKLNKHRELMMGKLARDRKIVKDVLRENLIELLEFGGWTTVRRSVAAIQRYTTAASTMKLQNHQLEISREVIYKDLKTKRMHWINIIRGDDNKIACLRDNLKNEHLNAQARLSYAEKWLTAKSEALELRCCTHPNTGPRKDHEKRVHKELLLSYDLQIKNLEENLKKWKIKYSVDIQEINKNLAEKSEQLQITRERRENLQQMFNLHAGEIRGWMTFKRERAARLAREERQKRSATNIQSWWRGVMVRRFFGQFKCLKNIKKSPAKGKKK